MPNVERHERFCFPCGRNFEDINSESERETERQREIERERNGDIATEKVSESTLELSYRVRSSDEKRDTY